MFLIGRNPDPALTLAGFALAAFYAIPLAAAPPGENEAPADPPESIEYETLSLRGQVVFLAPALERLYGIKSVPEVREHVLALRTADDELFPLVEDIRGRAFRRDKRLRGVDMELLVRRYKGSPHAQVIRVYVLKEGAKFELDYWCEICAIAMYELKACDCCQGDIELRLRKVEEPPAKRKNP